MEVCLALSLHQKVLIRVHAHDPSHDTLHSESRVVSAVMVFSTQCRIQIDHFRPRRRSKKKAVYVAGVQVVQDPLVQSLMKTVELVEILEILIVPRGERVIPNISFGGTHVAEHVAQRRGRLVAGKTLRIARLQTVETI